MRRQTAFIIIIASSAFVLSAAAAAPAAVIYVAAIDGNVRTVDSSGNVKTYASGATDGLGAAFGQNNNLFVAEYSQNEIVKITPAGVVSNFASIPSPQAITSDSSGNLYVTYGGDGSSANGKIYEISPTGSVSTFYSGIYFPSGIAVDSLGNVYTTTVDSDTVVKITPSKSLSNFAPLALNSNPGSLAFDANGNLYVPNGSTGTISKITSGGVEMQFASGMDDADGIAFDSSGLLYTDDTYTGAIYEVNQAGTVSTIANVGDVNPTGLAISVPEPSTFLLFGSVLVGLLLRKPRKISRGAKPSDS